MVCTPAATVKFDVCKSVYATGKLVPVLEGVIQGRPARRRPRPRFAGFGSGLIRVALGGQEREVVGLGIQVDGLAHAAVVHEEADLGAFGGIGDCRR